MIAWLRSLDLLDALEEAPLLEVAAGLGRMLDMGRINEDPEEAALLAAGRAAMNLLAARLPAYDFFAGAQERGIQVGIIYAPEEVIADPHFVARGFPTEVKHPELDRSFTYPGAPYRFTGVAVGNQPPPPADRRTHRRAAGGIRPRPRRPRLTARRRTQATIPRSRSSAIRAPSTPSEASTDVRVVAEPRRGHPHLARRAEQLRRDADLLDGAYAGILERLDEAALPHVRVRRHLVELEHWRETGVGLAERGEPLVARARPEGRREGGLHLLLAIVVVLVRDEVSWPSPRQSASKKYASIAPTLIHLPSAHW